MGQVESPQPVGMGSKTVLFNSMTKLNRKKRPKFKSYFTYKIELKLPKVNMGSKSATQSFQTAWLINVVQSHTLPATRFSAWSASRFLEQPVQVIYQLIFYVNIFHILL